MSKKKKPKDSTIKENLTGQAQTLQEVLNFWDYFKYAGKVSHPKLDIECRGTKGFEYLCICLKNGEKVFEQGDEKHPGSAFTKSKRKYWIYEGPWIEAFETLIREQMRIEEKKVDNYEQTLLDYWEN